MTSSFGWLDYSDRERRQTLEIVQLFRERDSRDELGIGSIRDAFSDMLFPGTSTIQTRAKYFLFIPWIYQDIERRRVPSSRVASDARNLEIQLIDALSQSEDTAGIIGIQAGTGLKQLPSTIYWQGLGRLGIREIPMSRTQYHRQLDHLYRLWSSQSRGDDEESATSPLIQTWHHGLPSAPSEFPGEARLRLSNSEAAYLHERIRTRASGSVFSFFVDRAENVLQPWDHPSTRDLADGPREELRLARFFSEVIWGAALLYNLMLAELTADENREQDYREQLVNWWKMLRDGSWLPDLNDDRHFWKVVEGNGTAIPIPTTSFVETWFSIVRDGLAANDKYPSLIDDSRPRNLIRQREHVLKRDRARLVNPRARELWGGSSGADQLNYRWPVARTIIADIAEGLRECS